MASQAKQEISIPMVEMGAQPVMDLPLGDNKSRTEDLSLVVFNEPYDAENPKQWHDRRKWAVTNILSVTGFNRILVSTIMAPALPIISAELHMNPTESAMSLSIYLLATAFGPLIIGPMSEVYGRQAILHFSNVWFLVWNLVCGFANTKELLIASRFLAGFGASAIYALAGGVLGDVWRPEQRGKSLGVYLAIPLLAVAVGPIFGGLLAGRASWRWLFFSTSIFQAIMVVFCFMTFHESYAPVVLKRRAARLRRETGNQQYQTPDERLDRDLNIFAVFGRALGRPLRLLAFHPIIQINSVISAFEYGVLYVILSSFAEVWSSHYGQSIEISGLHYIACALGEIVGAQIGGPLMDRLYKYMEGRASDGVHLPEFRLPLLLVPSIVGPLGLFVYGWSAQYLVHFIVVDLGIFINLLAGQMAGMPLQAYVMDIYADHISSALAASQFPKSLTAFLFPLFAPSLYQALGYGWGNSTIAFASLIIGLGGPYLLWRFGPRLRMKIQSLE